MKKTFGLMAILACLFAVTLGTHAPTLVRAGSSLEISTDYTFTKDLDESIIVTADNLVIDGNGFTLRGPGTGSGTGIYLNGRSSVTIRNLTVIGWEFDILLSNSSNNTISDNTIKYYDTKVRWGGLWLQSSSNNNISGNTITRNYLGLVLEASSNNNIHGNTITANWVGISVLQGSINNSISGNTITMQDFGVWLQSSSNYNSLFGNAIINTRWSIFIEASSNYNQIFRNTISNDIEVGLWTGFWLQSSSNNNISGNIITNKGTGIRLEASSNYNSIYKNTIIANNENGLWLFEGSSHNFIYHNNIIDNGRQANDTNPTTNFWHHPELLEGNFWSDYLGADDGSGTGKHAIADDGIGDTSIPWPDPNFDFYPFVQESGWLGVTTYITFNEDRYEPIVVTTDNLVIDGNGYTLQGPGSGTSISLTGRNNVTIKNLMITGWKDGVYMDSCQKVTLVNNIIADNEVGVNMGEESSHITLTGNTLSNNHLGVYMRMFCNDITIFNNTISHNEDGVHMEYCSRVRIANNTISHNHLGVRLWPQVTPTYVTVVNNTIFKNYDGIHMVYASNVNITNNLIFWNDINGVYLENCSDITIFLNTVIDNMNQVYDNKANHFDNGTIGNYWSDYTGIDTNGDGIGDTPYLIDADSMDNYPLIHPLKTLPVVPPSADFTYSPTDPSIEDTIDFMDTSTDPDGTITAWDWDFGDGATSTEQNPSHQYADKGEYTVQLTVTDNDGLTNTAEQTITLRNLPPTASFTYSPSEPTVGEEVLFSDASSDPEGQPITSWTWDFGDGTTSNEQNPTHVYETSGSYLVTLTVTDVEGLEGISSKTAKVQPVEEEGVFIPGFSLEMGLFAALTLCVFSLRKRRRV